MFDGYVRQPELENCAATDCPPIEVSTPLPMPVIRASISRSRRICVARRWPQKHWRGQDGAQPKSAGPVLLYMDGASKIVILSPICLLSVSLIQKVSLFQRTWSGRGSRSAAAAGWASSSRTAPTSRYIQRFFLAQDQANSGHLQAALTETRPLFDQVKRLRVMGFAGLGGKVDGGRNVTLSRLNVSRMGAGGIAISGGDRPTLTPCGHRLLDSEISFTDEWIFCAISRTLVGTCCGGSEQSSAALPVDRRGPGGAAGRRRDDRRAQPHPRRAAPRVPAGREQPPHRVQPGRALTAGVLGLRRV